MQGPVLSLIPIGLIVNQNASESEPLFRFTVSVLRTRAIDRDFKLVWLMVIAGWEHPKQAKEAKKAEHTLEGPLDIWKHFRTLRRVRMFPEEPRMTRRGRFGVTPAVQVLSCVVVHPAEDRCRKM